jgi:phosphoribosyl-AMP cyclohydrolase/phosphoribosyl-ATP pyrophosphohydrolase
MNTLNTSNLTLDFAKYSENLMPTIAQDVDTWAIMMVGFANPLALEETRKTGLATFWSRSRNELWTKWLTSGDTLEIRDIFTDCDNDTLVYLVKVNGSGACHIEGWKTCFRRRVSLITGEIENKASDLPRWSRVLLDEEQMIVWRKTSNPETSSTAKALQWKVSRIAQKVAEEWVEVSLAFMEIASSNRAFEEIMRTAEEIDGMNWNRVPDKARMGLTTEAILERMDNEKFLIGEVTDLMYRLQILLVKANISWESIESEIVKRRK